jgi:hypothetical protein
MYTKNVTGQPLTHFRAWRATQNFPMHAIVNVLVNTPRWRPGGLGHDFWIKVLGPLTENGEQLTTVAACIEAAKPFGLSAYDTQLHLKWLFTWGDQCTIGGHAYTATAPVANVPQTSPQVPKAIQVA